MSAREHEIRLWKKHAIASELSASEKAIFAWALEGLDDEALVAVDARVTHGVRDVVAIRRPTAHDMQTLTER